MVTRAREGSDALRRQTSVRLSAYGAGSGTGLPPIAAANSSTGLTTTKGYDMGSAFENVNDAKAKLLERMKAAVAETGVFKIGTCATGEYFGWDMNAHYAMEWFRRNPPQGLHVSCITKFECQDWVVTEN